jgi:hypothetical protein
MNTAKPAHFVKIRRNRLNFPIRGQQTCRSSHTYTSVTWILIRSQNTVTSFVLLEIFSYITVKTTRRADPAHCFAENTERNYSSVFAGK